jgi:glycosyltransferase involved in cell wall biosynthesis
VKILVITDGVEPLLHHTVVGLADRGHVVHVIGALRPGELDPVQRFRLGSSIRLVTTRNDGSFRRTLNFVRSVALSATANPRTLRRVTSATRRHYGIGRPFRLRMTRYVLALAERSDVVYFEAANVAAEYSGVLDQLGPKVVMCTGSDVKVLPENSRRLAESLPGVFAQMARVVCRSEDLRQWAIRRGAFPERTEVLLAAPAAAYFSPAQRPPRGDGVLRLVSIGRHHWVKGYEIAIEALAEARRAGHDVVYTIVGADEGSEAAARYAVRDLGLEDSVVLTGSKPLTGVRAAFARSDVLVVSSVSEGMSVAAIEAMAMGLPVITTDAGGMAELVEHGVNGLVVPRRDSRALADAIGLLASDPELRAEMAEHALHTARRFDLTTHLDRIEQLLVDVAHLNR